MKTARDEAHECLNDRCGDRYERFGHTGECDRLTQIIASRDAEWRTALTLAREALAGIRDQIDDEGAAMKDDNLA